MVQMALEQVKDRVSVVTPVYNGEKYLNRLLDSVLAQSWDQVEMILVDDGSQDRTLEVAEAYRDKFRERGFSYHVVAAQHKNASGAVNGGLPLVTGEFLIWPDGDDALEKDSIRKRVEFLREHPQYQCVRSLGRYLDEKGRLAPPEERQGNLEEEQLFFPVLEGKTFVCCGCYMLRTEPFFALYPERKIPEYDVGQNFQMLLPFLYFHRCPTIKEELYTVYLRGDSHSHRVLTRQQKEKKYTDYERLVDELAGICGIRDEAELHRIERWKRDRRYRLYLQCGERRNALRVLYRQYRQKDLTGKTFLLRWVRVLCGRDLRQGYRKIQVLWKRRENEN